MLKARIMDPSEMRTALGGICRASGRSPEYFMRRLAEPHRHGCVLLEEIRGGDSDAGDDASGCSLFEEPVLRGFLMFSIDRKAGLVRIGESRVFPQAGPEGLAILVGHLGRALEELGLAMPISTVLAEDDPGMDSLRGLGFRAKALKRGQFGASRDGFELVLNRRQGGSVPDDALA